MKDVLRSTVMDSGEQYVIMELVILMYKLSVNNWDITITIDTISLTCKRLNAYIFRIILKYETTLFCLSTY